VIYFIYLPYLFINIYSYSNKAYNNKGLSFMDLNQFDEALKNFGFNFNLIIRLAYEPK